MFYLLFGLSFTGRSTGVGVGPAEYLLAGYTVFGAVTAALFAFGAGVAVERAQGWLVLKRATPMPVSVYLGAKVVSCMVFGALIVLVMAVCGTSFGGVRLPFSAWLSLLALATLGCVPFCLLGLSIAFLVPPAGASGIVNLINLPLAFASGMWVPVNMLPRVFQAIAPALPQYHMSAAGARRDRHAAVGGRLVACRHAVGRRARVRGGRMGGVAQKRRGPGMTRTPGGGCGR